MKNIFNIIIVFALMLSGVRADAQTPDALWKGVGGKSKWDSTNYILFTANGRSMDSLGNARKFLINKKSGQVRFEGQSSEGNQLVALFNFKSHKLTKLSRGGQELKATNEESTALFTLINKQFQRDASFIFLPVLLENANTTKGTETSKIVNSEKLQAFSFELNNNTLSGEILYNPETGQIKQVIDQSGNEYFVNNYKDIGGGLILPTTFKSMSMQGNNATYTTVAAFTEMEESKFTSL
ncbi:MAG: hypothetical protein ACTJHT_09355 [Sphingobacterium sp.]|uniref:hypothetical protein n=1 Tax=Sphingobacterium sp. JB170 TaxID=1434842 RepID=UPI000B35B23D|nr:hypothetical protein [Sphingobacterium sp. JB170]